MKHRFALLGLAASFLLSGAGICLAQGHEEEETPAQQSWSFSGPFGKFDRAQLQRGFQIYREVCSNCHSLDIAFRTLGEPGGPEFSAAEVKALAAEYKIKDGPDDDGNMFERPGLPSDHIPYNFPNPQAAMASNNGAYPPPMRTLAKARTYERGFPLFVWDLITQYQEQGQDYIYGILTGYKDPPKGFDISSTQYYDEMMPGHKIAMPKPLNDGQVTYSDGSPQTVDQYARDIVAFLTWTADPSLEERKKIGLRVMVFLFVFLFLLLYVKKKLWAEVDGAAPTAAH
jgi:cytochrome c1